MQINLKGIKLQKVLDNSLLQKIILQLMVTIHYMDMQSKNKTITLQRIFKE